MESNGTKEEIHQSDDRELSIETTQFRQITAKSDAILSEIRRLHFKLTLTLGVLVFIALGVWQ